MLASRRVGQTGRFGGTRVYARAPRRHARCEDFRVDIAPFLGIY